MKKTNNSALDALAAKTAPATIGFRLDDEHRNELGKRAVKAGVSPHELARLFVLAALHDSEELPALRGAVLSLEEQITQLRRDLTLAVEAILVMGGQETPENVNAWVRQNLHCD